MVRGGERSRKGDTAFTFRVNHFEVTDAPILTEAAFKDSATGGEEQSAALGAARARGSKGDIREIACMLERGIESGWTLATLATLPRSPRSLARHAPSLATLPLLATLPRSGNAEFELSGVAHPAAAVAECWPA